MDKLTLPDKLYGRDQDIVTLLESFERVSGGHGEVMLVHGRSGAGKTALVHELRLPIRARNGFFIKGKFNQYQQNIPYFAFKQALAELCRELQSGDAQQRARCRDEIAQGVGPRGQLLVDLVPEFEALLGPQPPLEAVSPQEARHRFAEMFRSFLGAVCRPEHPMVIFIDDWQWADAASFELLQQIEVGRGQRYLLFIVSYRDNEVDAAHPLTSTVAYLRGRSVPVFALSVANLTVDDVRDLLADTLPPAVTGLDALAGMIHDKTLGNPFFVRSYLLFLHEIGVVWLDREQNRWLWRPDAGAERLPDDVVELLAAKLRRMDDDSRNLFFLAACLGNRFELQTLALVSGLDTQRCLDLLQSPGATEVFRLEGGEQGGGEFLHDRMQQAAYMLVEPQARPALLLKIGRLLLQHLKPEQLAEQLFEVANDLNAGAHLLQDEAERKEVLELNLAAARKAYDATAYSAALLYYRCAARFLEDAGSAERLWSCCRQTAMSLSNEQAVCEFLVGDIAAAEACIRNSVARSVSPLERAEALCILIVQYTLQARYPEAIEAGRQALESLGITLPDADYDQARDREIELVRGEIGARSIAALAGLPAMSDPETLMSAKILITMGPPCYRAHQKLWSVIVPMVVNLTLRHGNIPQVGYSHPAFGGLLGWVQDDYRSAREFGEVATRLMTDTFTNPADQSVFYLMIGSSVRHWSRHLKYGSQDYRDAYQIGLRSGNLQYAAYAFGHDMYCQFYQGTPLPGLMLEAQRSLEFSRARLNRWAGDLLEGGLQLFGRLAELAPVYQGSPSFTEKDYLARVEEHGNSQVGCIYRVLKASCLLHLGEYGDALALSDQTEPMIYTVGTQGLLPWPEHVFARFLILAALHQEEPAGQPQRRAEMELLAAKLGVWAEHSPENFRHMRLLACAELAAIDGRFEAVSLYDEAIQEAQRGDFLQWAAFANERASLFWRRLGNAPLSHSCWRQAYLHYARWGACAKVKRMEAQYRALLEVDTSATGGVIPGGIADLVVERQLTLLRDHVAQLKQDALRGEALTQARELARATQQLRLEIAERKRTEAALRQSEDRFRTLFMEAPLGIALVDSLSGRIHEANPMFARIAGRSVEELAQTDWLKITHPDDLERDLEQMALVTSGKSDGYRMEKRYLRPDGGEVWINMAVAPVAANERGEPRHLCLIEDITARKQAEKDKRDFDLQLLQTQKLESLGVLAGGIAHDFNNILMAIIGNADLALMKLSPSSPAAENLHAIEAASSRAAELAKQMLAYSGKGKFVVAPVDMNRLLDEMLHILKVSISKKAVLCLNKSGNLPAVEADATQLRQVVMNLVINASEAIGDRSGVIAISTGVMLCDREYLKNFWLDQDIAEGSYVCLEVSDTGCGMDEQTLSKIFDPFFTTKFTGRGLGMAAVLGIVRGHNGGIRIYSEPGKGTTFRLLLPASSKSAEAADVVGEADDWKGSGKVLLVDDEETVQVTGSVMLRTLGFTPVVAADGREALEIYRREPGFAFVILDLTMPHMDGEQCLNALRELDPDVKVIMSSGYNEQDVSQRFTGKGFTSFIQKPYRFADLKEVIRRLE